MARKELIFHVGSRKPFAEEAPVVDAAQQAAAQIAHKYGTVEGSAVFKVFSNLSAKPTVYPQAVDIVRHGIAEVAGAGARAGAGHAEAVVREIANEEPAEPQRPSAIRNANRQLSESMRRLGIEM